MLVVAALAACSHHQPAVTAPLTEAVVAVPLAPGKTAAWRASIEELTGPRYAEYEASRKRFGLTAQMTFLQQTPMGDFAVIHLTGPDVHRSFHEMTSSTDPWDVSWRQLTTNLHGIDFNAGERVFPKLELAYAMEATGDTTRAQPFMFLAPLGPGGAARFRELGRELMGARHADYVRARAQLGVRREVVFLESTAMGDAAVIYWLADDPKAALARLTTSSDPFDQWLRAQAAQLHPLPLEQVATIASHNELIGEYPHRPSQVSPAK